VVIDKAGNVAFKGNRGAGSDVSAVKEKVEEILAIIIMMLQMGLKPPCFCTF
jgi:hypothetical protein